MHCVMDDRQHLPPFCGCTRGSLAPPLYGPLEVIGCLPCLQAELSCIQVDWVGDRSSFLLVAALGNGPQQPPWIASLHVQESESQEVIS